jgi:hypothetical protein
MSRCPQNEGRRDQLFGPVTTMKVDYPYKTATIEEDATVLPRPDLHGCSSFPYSAMEGVPPNAEIAGTSEMAARCQNPGTGLYEQSALRRWGGGSGASEIS